MPSSICPEFGGCKRSGNMRNVQIVCFLHFSPYPQQKGEKKQQVAEIIMELSYNMGCNSKTMCHTLPDFRLRHFITSILLRFVYQSPMKKPFWSTTWVISQPRDWTCAVAAPRSALACHRGCPSGTHNTCPAATVNETATVRLDESSHHPATQLLHKFVEAFVSFRRIILAFYCPPVKLTWQWKITIVQ